MKHLLLRHKVHSVKLRSFEVEVAVETIFDKVGFLADLFDDVRYLLALEELSDLGLL